MTTLAEWLDAKPFTLAMSSGFFGFFAHTGFLAGLEERGLRPSAVRGSSAGALVTGSFAAGLCAQDLAAILFKVRRQDFWDPRPGFGLLGGRLFDRLLRDILPVDQIELCGIPVTLSVFDVLGRRTELLSTGDLATAIRASCALPGLFHPVTVDGRPKLDGGIADRPGLHGLPDDARVLYHHLLPNSPWRKKNGIHARLPQKSGVIAVATPGLPRVTPFALDQGQIAFNLAKNYALQMLDQEYDHMLES